VFKDTRELARVTVGMVEALLQGGDPGNQRHLDL
jgi:ABC-type xylose transport system substrate-binding protein